MSNILLTKTEIAAVVKAWVDEDWESRTIRLNRGHWEDIAPVIAQAQIRNVVEWMEERDFWISKDDVQELRKAAGL